MKYSNKYMLVPYVKPIESIEENKVVSLDNHMESILNQKGLDISTKIKLYNKALSEFNKAYDPASQTLPGILSNLASKNQVQIEQTIKKEFEEFDQKNSKEIASIKEELAEDAQTAKVIKKKLRAIKKSQPTTPKNNKKQKPKPPTTPVRPIKKPAHTPFVTPGEEPGQRNNKRVRFDNEDLPAIGSLSLSDSPNLYDGVKTRNDRKAPEQFQAGNGLNFFQNYVNLKF
jgi:hypothetical protein